MSDYTCNGNQCGGCLECQLAQAQHTINKLHSERDELKAKIEMLEESGALGANRVTYLSRKNVELDTALHSLQSQLDSSERSKAEMREALQVCRADASWPDVEILVKSGFPVVAQVLDNIKHRATKSLSPDSGKRFVEVEKAAKCVEEFPSDSKKCLVEIFYLKDHEPFVCGISGKVTGDQIAKIEKDCAENPGVGFEKGNGTYLFSCHWESGQYGDEGRCEIAPYWHLDFIGFKPIPDESLTSHQPEQNATNPQNEKES